MGDNEKLGGVGSGDNRYSATGLDLSVNGVASTEPHKEPFASAKLLRWYVTALLTTPVLYMASCFAVMRSEFFIKRTQSVYVANMGYGLRLRHADCQVLIFGDSSAMEGVDPAIVERQTGMSTCNIADTAGNLRLNGTMVLDTYLQRNRRPNFLVFQLAPNNLAPSWLHEGNYEAVLLRVREQPDLALFYVTLRHTEDVLSAIAVSGRFLLTWLAKPPLPSTLTHGRDLTHGRMVDSSPRMTACLSDTYINPPSREWTEFLRTHYGVDGTQVVIDVTPVPNCDPAVGIYKEELGLGNGIIDNEVRTFPTSWYTQSGHFHLGSPEGWTQLSVDLGNQLNRLKQGEGVH